MKKQVVSIFAYSILGLSAVMVSCGGDSTKSKSADTESVASEMAFLRVDIDGMTCAVGCAKTIEKMLSETEGVTSAEVDYDKKAAFINYDKAKVSEANLLKSISEFKDGTYKAMVSSKSCKSDCKKACCAVAKAKKVVKKVTEEVKDKTEKTAKTVVVNGSTTLKVSETKAIDAVKRDVAKRGNDLKSTTVKEISSQKEVLEAKGVKAASKGLKTISSAKKTVKATRSTSADKVRTAKKIIGN